MTFQLNHLSNSIETATGIKAAVMQSLLNHERAELNDRLDPDESKQGWWGRDYLKAVGCRDWTLKREKLTQDTLNRVLRYTRKSLEWLKDDGHVKNIEVIGEYKDQRLNRLITITLKDDQTLEITL